MPRWAVRPLSSTVDSTWEELWSGEGHKVGVMVSGPEKSIPYAAVLFTKAREKHRIPGIGKEGIFERKGERERRWGAEVIG